MEIDQTDVLSPEELIRGPDLFRPGRPGCILDPAAKTFLYTQYPDGRGNRWFCESATVGHEWMIVRPEVLPALLGPRLHELEAEIAFDKEVYLCDPVSGFPVQDEHGPVVVGHERFFDHWKIRLLSRDTNLYGRAGHVRGRLAVMLWLACEGWQDKLDATLELLGAWDDDVITLGQTWQFLVRDFRRSRNRPGSEAP